MLPTTVLNRFVECCPATVMVRATLEQLLRPERLDQIFEENRQRQYVKGVSLTALYDKLNHLELETSAAMVRETAADAGKLIDAMPAAKKEVLPGLEVYYLDGHHLAATEHRWAELRRTRQGPLPGHPWHCWDAQRKSPG